MPSTSTAAAEATPAIKPAPRCHVFPPWQVPYPVTVMVYVTFSLAGPNVGVPGSMAAKLVWWTRTDSGPT
jgi:hypothetical protein